MKTVRVIRMDRSGHFQGAMDVEDFKEYDWKARREVVIVRDTQVETLEDFLRATEQSQDKTPEVWFFPPWRAGRASPPRRGTAAVPLPVALYTRPGEL